MHMARKNTIFSYPGETQADRDASARHARDVAATGYIPENQLADHDFRAKQTHFINDVEKFDDNGYSHPYPLKNR